MIEKTFTTVKVGQVPKASEDTTTPLGITHDTLMVNSSCFARETGA